MKVFGKQHYLAYARYLLLILFDLVSCIILDSSSHGVVTFMGEETEDPKIEQLLLLVAQGPCYY